MKLLSADWLLFAGVEPVDALFTALIVILGVIEIAGVGVGVGDFVGVGVGVEEGPLVGVGLGPIILITTSFDQTDGDEQDDVYLPILNEYSPEPL